ncbi:MAG: pseudaminic acid synthase [Planctomycetota bacterium]|jgi:pseudaminic acid synthase
MSIEINNQLIGKSQPVYIIAELSANHNGDYECAQKMIQAAKDAGADAVKLQTYTAETITMKCESELFRIKGGTLWDGRYLYDLYKEASTPWQWQPLLKELADSIGITLFSSPFDKTAVDFLEEMEVPAYKIASFEAVDIPLIEYTAAKGKPVIISTGICSEVEIYEAIETCYRAGNNDVILLKCTSSYPSPLDKMNLLSIPYMQERFKVPVGLSDHTMNIETPVAAVTLGASLIEKHFTLDRALGGVDAGFSLNIEEFSQMVHAVRNTEKLLGTPSYDVSEQSRKFARSLFVVKNIEKGEILTKDNVRSIRPADGLAPKHFKDIIGKRAAINLKSGTPLKLDYVKK